jgi:hypothetical protein
VEGASAETLASAGNQPAALSLEPPPAYGIAMGQMMFNHWLTLTLRTFELGVEAQNVVALRLLRIASGDARGQSEVSRMVTEKIAAVAEAQVPAATAVVTGHDHHVAAGKALGVFKKRVRANKRRLSRRG